MADNSSQLFGGTSYQWRPERWFGCGFGSAGGHGDGSNGEIRFILLGTTTLKQNEKINEIGQVLVPRALNQTKKIRKASADIFANVGLGIP